ncbi:MAG: Ig-like domain-containing protein [Pseudomonadota bacterium]
MRTMKAVALAFLLALALPAIALGQNVNRIFPHAAHDPVNNRNLLVYSTYYMDPQTEEITGDIRGRLLDEWGAPLTGEFLISGPLARVEAVQPSVAFSPEAGVYLAVWEDGRNSGASPQTDIYGQLVDADGQCVLRGSLTPGHDNFGVSLAPNDQSTPALAYDPASQRFFCVFSDNRDMADIYGQMVAADGTPYSVAVETNFPVAAGRSFRHEPAVAFDPETNRYLVVFENSLEVGLDIHGQLVTADGTPYSTTVQDNFPVSSVPGDQRLPSVAFLAGANRFLVAWEDYRNDPYDADIYGQLVTSESAMYSTTAMLNFPVSTAPWGQAAPLVSADPDLNHFAVFFEDWRDYADIYGQLVSPEAAPLTTAVDENFFVAGPLDEWLHAPVLGPEGYLLGYAYTAHDGLTQLTWTRAGKGFAPLDQEEFLMGWWPMDEGEGQSTADLSPYGNDAQLTGTSWAPDAGGEAGRALYFDGTASMATIPDHNALDLSTDLTLSLWVRPQDTESSGPRTLAAKKGPVEDISWALTQYGADVEFAISVTGVQFDAWLLAPGVLDPGRWTHLAAVYDGYELRLYVDGAQRDHSFQLAPLYAGDTPVTLGGMDGYFQGWMDDVRIYRRSLSQESVLALAGFTGLLTGTLSRPDESPVANGEVNANPLRGDRLFTAISDADGAYTLVLPPGCYHVEAVPPGDSGLQRLPKRLVEVLDKGVGETREDFVFPEGAYSVSGVIYAGGLEAPFALVSFQGATGVAARTSADVTGAYTLTNLSPGPGVVQGEWPGSGFSAWAVPVDLSGNLSGVDLHLPLGASLSGRVTAMDGTPLEGIRVSYQGAVGNSWMDAMTDPAGWFHLTSLPPGMGWVQVLPDPLSGYVSSPEIPVALNEGADRSLGVLDLLPGAKVTGRLVLPGGAPAPCGFSVESMGPGYAAETQVCGGVWSMNLPVGVSVVSLNLSDEAMPAPASAYPITVTVTLQDLGAVEVPAPDMILTHGVAAGSLLVTPEAPQGWNPPLAGKLVVSALAAGTLPDPAFLDGVLSAVTVNGASASAGVPVTVGPLAPGAYDVLLVWRAGRPDDEAGSETILDSALGVVVNAGDELDISLTLPGTLASAHGTVMNDNGAAVPGAQVLVMGAGGSMVALARADASGMYTIPVLPAGAGGTVYVVTAGHPLYADEAGAGFAALPGQDSLVPDIVLTYVDSLYATLLEKYVVLCTGNVFLGEAGWFAHRVNEVRMGPAPGTGGNLVSAQARYTPGKAVQNVFWENQFTAPDGWVDEKQFPDHASDPNTQLADYTWTNLPEAGPDTLHWGLVATDSALPETAWSIPLDVTRSVISDAAATPYSVTVRVEATVTETGYGTLLLDILEDDLPIAEAVFDGSGQALKTEGETGDSGAGGVAEEILPQGGYRLTVFEPQSGTTYSYEKVLMVTPLHNQGAVHYTPHVRALLSSPPALLPVAVEGNTLSINHPGTVGDLSVTPANQVFWDPVLAKKMLVVGTDLPVLATEDGAARPEVETATPPPDSMGAQALDPLIIRFTKGMNPGSLYLRVEDDRGNLACDTHTGIVLGDINWFPDAEGNQVVSFQPYSGFTEGTAWKVTVQAGDAAGYSMAGPDSWWFAAAPLSGDVEAPRVLSVFPPSKSSDLPPVMPRVLDPVYVTAVFSEAVDPASLADGLALERLDAPGGSVLEAVSGQVLFQGNMATFVPDQALWAGSPYRATVAAGVRDTAGLSLESALAWEFTTGPEEYPAWVFTSPVAGATDMPLWRPFPVAYPDREIDPATLADAFTVTDADQTDWTSWFEPVWLGPAKGLALLKAPWAEYLPLDPYTEYTVTLGPGVLDNAGQPPDSNPFVFSFTTVASQGNAMPQIVGVPALPFIPYPRVSVTPGGVSLDLLLRAIDEDSARPGDILTARVELDGLSLDLAESVSRPGLLGYRTQDLPPGETVAAGSHTLTYTAGDLAGHEVSLVRPATVMGGPVVLDAPENGTQVPWPPVVSWNALVGMNGLAGARAYQVTAYTAGDLTRKAGAWLVSDDGRAVPYTLTLPADLPGDTLFWRVTALADLAGPLAPTGVAVSEVRSFSRDLTGPELIPVSPLDNDFGVEPRPVITALLSDADSGVYTPSISLWVGVNQATPQPVEPGFYTLDDSDPFNVLVVYQPQVPFPPLAEVVVELDAADLSGNPMNPSPMGFAFTVRDNLTLDVPGDSDSISGALDLATQGDRILVGPGVYPEVLVIGPGLAGLTLASTGGPDQTLISNQDMESATISLQEAPGVTIQGFSISGGLMGVDVGPGSQDYLLSGNRISDGLTGVLITSDGPGRLENNLIHGCGDALAVMDANTEDGTVPEPVIVNNTLADNGSGIVLNDSAPVILYNVVAGNTVEGISESPAIGAATLAYNCVYGNGPDGLVNYTGLAPGVGDIGDDPLFVDAPEGDYRLMPDSPCVNAVPLAESTTPPEAPAVDHDGVDRPQGAAVDMGAFEMDLAFVSTPVPTAEEEQLYTYEALALGRGVLYGFAPGSGHPSAMSVDPVSGQVTYTPVTDSEAGLYPISLTATDAFGRTVTQDWGLTITAVNDPPMAPVPEGGGSAFYAMAGRPFNLRLNATDEETQILTWAAGGAPQGMSFSSVGPGYGTLSWVPGAANVNSQYPITPRVTDGTAAAMGLPITLTVLPSLALTPGAATPLLLGSEGLPVACTVAGGMPPYRVVVFGSPLPTGSINGLDQDGYTLGAFSFVPLAGGTSHLRITDALGFVLTSGAFAVSQVQTFFLSGSPSLVPGESYGFTVENQESPLNGLVLTIPAGALSESMPLTISQATGAPHLGEADGGFLQLGPDGVSFLEDLLVEYPYTGESALGNLLAFTFDPETGRWANIPIAAVNHVSGTVSIPLSHFSLYTVAEPSSLALALAGGDQPVHYRMRSIPAQPAASADLAALLGTPGNLGPYDETQWRLFGFNPPAQWDGDPNAYYTEATDPGFAVAQPLEPGRAWWVISRQNATVMVPGLATDPGGDFYLTLEPGWNAVGSPFSIQADWSEVLASPDGETFFPPGDNSPANPLYNQEAEAPEPLFLYDPENPQAGPDGYVETTVMTPYDGFWVYNNAPGPAVLWLRGSAMLMVGVQPKARDAKKSFWARLLAVRSVFAGDAARRPPLPPGSSGDNKGVGDDAIGVASGSSGCFVRTAAGAPVWPLLLFLALALAALATRLARMRRG